MALIPQHTVQGGPRNDELMQKLTKTQREAIVGLLLGDGSMQTQNNGRTYRLIHVQGGRKGGVYTDHLFEVFGPWRFLLRST